MAKIKREKSTNSKSHYVTNSTLLPAVIEAKKLEVVTEKLIKMIRMIAERYSQKFNFARYTYREDMVSAAVTNMCNNALKFNPEKSSNPFSYYTTGIHNSFLQYMADEKKHRNIRDALISSAGANPSFNYSDDDSESHGSDDIEITDTKLLEADDIPAMTAPVDIGDILGITRSSPSYSKQMFWALDPGAPGKNKLSSHSDHNPGPVIVYGPDDWIQDPVTGKVTVKPRPPEPPPPKQLPKKRKTAKKKVKKKVTKKVPKKVSKKRK